MKNEIYISEPVVFTPGLETKEDLILWADGKKEILFEKTSPSLSYTDPLFRRRLSQLCKMTVEVVHNLLSKTGIGNNTKLAFISFRGEIEREFKLNKSLFEDQMILPASFSLSVFNSPIALATIESKIQAGYSAIFPTDDNFRDGFFSAAASVLCESQDKVILVYADELIPDEYSGIAPKEKPPLAFACILSKEKLPEIYSTKKDLVSIDNNVYNFLKNLIISCYNNTDLKK